MNATDLQAMQGKTKPFPFIPSSGVLFKVSQSAFFILSVNWLFQGMRGMDKKELIFRLVFEFFCLVLFVLCFKLAGIGSLPAFIAALIIAHSINYTLNGQFWVCARYCYFYRPSLPRLMAFDEGMRPLINKSGFIDEALLIGSRAGPTWHERSDIDLRIVYQPGFLAWLNTSILLMRLRYRAFFLAVPLDLYAYDDLNSLLRFDQEEPLHILKDHNGAIRRKFAHRKIKTDA